MLPRKGGLGMAPQEGFLRPGAGRKDMERGVKWSHGERGIHSTGEGSSDLRQEFLEGSRFRRCRILGGRPRRDYAREGARKPREECECEVQRHWTGLGNYT